MTVRGLNDRPAADAGPAATGLTARGEESMKFDIWYDFRNPPRWRRDPQALYREIIDQIAWADGLGFSSAWLSEHHFTDEGYLPAMMPMLAAMAMRTRNMRLGTAVLLAPLHHPLCLAEEAAVVDILSDGRLDLGLAPGYRVREFETLGVAKSERGRRTDETIELLIRAWTTEEVTYSGEYFSFEGVPVQPHPVQDPHPPIWIGGSTPAAARRAARFGCDFMPDSGAAADVYRIFAEESRAAGREPGEIATNMVVYVCEDPERGWNEVKEHYLYVHQTYQRWFAEAGDVAQLADPIGDADLLSRDTHLVGTPEMVIEAIERRRRTHPFERLIFWARPPGLPIELSSASLELFASRVIPHFDAALQSIEPRG